MSKPKVSVIMSVYNGARYLREAVESILNQTFSELEFIIINDGSTDNTSKILKSYNDPRIKIINNRKNIGLTKSLNQGLRLARGEYIARMDADDVSLPKRLAKQVRYLQHHKNVGLLGTAYDVLDAQGQRIATHRHPLTDTEIRWKMLFHNAFCHTSVMFRKDLFDARKLYYDENLSYSQDYDLWGKLLEGTCARNLPQPFVSFRVHKGSIENANRVEQQDIALNVSAQQISKLAPDLTLSMSEIQTLRNWYNNIPRMIGKKDIVLCKSLLQILSAFEKQRNVNRKTVKRLRQGLINLIFNALPDKHHSDIWKTYFLDFVNPKKVRLVFGRAFRRLVGHISGGIRFSR
jgi:glycosyltransferase involved in cell wall biosynthesis